MPKNKNAYLRYLIIHSQLKRNKYKYGYPTLEDLLWYLEDEGFRVSASTVEKDLRFMKYERGAPLIYDRKQRCYRYTEEWEFDIPLSPDDLRILRMLVHKLEIFGDAKEFMMVRDSIEKLTGHFELANRYPKDYVDKYILFEYTKGFKGKHLLSPIYEAIYENRQISFTHCKYDTDIPTERVIQPYSLKEHRNRWYLIGIENGEPRIFGLDRISGLEITDKFFLKEPGFYDEIFEVLRDSVGIMAFGFKSRDVILHFNREQSNYVKSLMLHRSQEVIKEDENGITIKIHVKITREFIMDSILRYGDTVKIMKPPELREEVKEIYSSALKLYEK